VGGAPAKKDCGTGSKEGRRSKKGKRKKEEEVGSSKLEETKCNEEESQANG
jgi:hypothetical protein